MVMDFRKKLRIWVHSIRGFRTIHWIMMVAIGYIIRPDLNSSNLLDFLLPALSVAFLWHYTTILNDIYDIEIDKKAHPDRPLVKGEISIEEYHRLGLLSLMSAGILSALSGFLVFVGFLLYFFMAVIYSKPPLRIRNRAYGTIIMGLASGVEIFSGYFSHTWIWDMNIFYINSINGLLIPSILIAISALTVAPNITAYLDYESDVEAGANTIYTVLGKEKGKKMVSYMLVVLFLLPAVIFPTLMNIGIGAILGFSSYLFFYRFTCVKCVFVAYFSELIYFMLYYIFLK